MSRRLVDAIAAAAAQVVVEEGLEYASAKRKAARHLAGRGARASDLPRNEEVEDAVREYLTLFKSDSQPLELAALRKLAMRWMDRLSVHRPHVTGAVWRGTATARSAVHLDLYCDDPKAAEIDLINLRVPFDVGGDARSESEGFGVLTLADRAPELAEPVTLHLWVHDLDDLRGALKPDARGQSWRGDLEALRRLVSDDEARQAADVPSSEPALRPGPAAKRSESGP